MVVCTRGHMYFDGVVACHYSSSFVTPLDNFKSFILHLIHFPPFVQHMNFYTMSKLIIDQAQAAT